MKNTGTSHREAPKADQTVKTGMMANPRRESPGRTLMLSTVDIRRHLCARPCSPRHRRPPARRRMPHTPRPNGAMPSNAAPDLPRCSKVATLFKRERSDKIAEREQNRNQHSPLRRTISMSTAAKTDPSTIGGIPLLYREPPSQLAVATGNSPGRTGVGAVQRDLHNVAAPALVVPSGAPTGRRVCPKHRRTATSAAFSVWLTRLDLLIAAGARGRTV